MVRTIRPSLKHMASVPGVVDVGKKGRMLIDPWGYREKSMPFVKLP